MTTLPSVADGEISPPRSGGFLRWRRPLPWVILIVVVLVLLVVAAGVWIGVRALAAQQALGEAESLVGDLRSAVVDDPAEVGTIADRIEDRTRSARSLTDDAIWRAAEATPLLGVNLAVVRQLAENVDEVAQSGIRPLASVASTLDPATLRPVDGRIDLAPLAAAAAPVASADDAFRAALSDVEAIRSAGAVDVVTRVQSRLAGLLTEAVSLTGSARAATQLLPSMLGADGPRDYLLMVQNNAEARSLGGNPAALVLVSVVDGRIEVAQQASSLDFPRGGPPPIDLDPNLYSVYYPDFSRYVMDITTRPDFPTAAELAKAYWERQFGGTVDGVVSFDPVALGYLLEATGPVTLATGDTLTSENAVSLLLSEVYTRYEDPRLQDAFFASAASAVFNAVTGGGVDVERAVESLTRSTDQRRLMVWSAHPEEEELIATTPLSGTLPSDNAETTTVGVYFMDQSSSKMDYYLDTAVKVGSDQCEADAPVFDADVTLTSSITQAEADALPAYVASTWWKGEKFKTDVYVVGPVGSTFVETSRQDLLLSAGTDLGRPVVRLSTFLVPGETQQLTVKFAGGSGALGPLAAVTTPMVRPTTVSLSTPGC